MVDQPDWTKPVAALAPPYTVITTIDLSGQSSDYAPPDFTVSDFFTAVAFRFDYTASGSGTIYARLQANVLHPENSPYAVTEILPGPAVTNIVPTSVNAGDTVRLRVTASGFGATYPANFHVDVLGYHQVQAVYQSPLPGCNQTTGQVSIATTGTAVRLQDPTVVVPQANYGTLVRALAANTNVLRVGDSGVTTSIGDELSPGEFRIYPIGPCRLWVNGTAGDKAGWFVT